MKRRTLKHLALTALMSLLCCMMAESVCAESEVSTPFLYKDFGEVVTVTGYKTECGAELVIPEEINGKPVAAIGVGAFAGRGELCKVILPETIIAIGEYAFENCKNLTEVIMPSGQTAEFDHTAFFNCSALTEITVGDSRITGFTDNIGRLMGSFDGKEDVPLNGMTTHPFKLFLPAANCIGFTLDMTVKEYTGDPFGPWLVYAREGKEEWREIAEFELHEDSAGEKETFPFVFGTPVSFDSLALVAKNGVQHGTSFSVSFYDAVCRFSIDGK